MFRFLGFMTGTVLVIGAMVTVLGTPALETGSPRVAADVTVPPPESIATAASIAATAVLLAEVSGPDGQVENFSIPNAPADPEQAAEPITASAAPMGTLPDPQATTFATATEAATDLQPSGEPMARFSASADAVEDAEFNRQTAPWGAPDAMPAASDTRLDARPPNPVNRFADAEALPGTLPEDAAPLAAEGPETSEPPMADSNAQWHAFWQPFRSQIAANGFAARLKAVTNMDYRVVRRMPGAYEVAFAYADASELSAKLARIETATGLDLPEAGP